MKKYLKAEELQLVFSGNNYFDLLHEIIDNSKEILQLQTYIFESDETGLKVIASLKKAAARGVKVIVLADAYGSFPFNKDSERELKSAGIQFRLYSPLFSSESAFFGRRLHHKIVVADKKIGMIGGINVANKYNVNKDEATWLDYGVLVKGQVCEYLDLLCEQVYDKRKRSKLQGWELKKQDPVPGDSLIRFRRNDFIKSRNEIHQSYLESIKHAKTSITIVASYFLPGNNFRRLLRQASARGVKIRIILAGISDVNSVKLAQEYLYEFYLTHNIQLFEWQNSVLHGKAMMIDDKWITIGSYNLNFLSHYISIELNADIIDEKVIQDFSKHIETIIQQSCSKVELKNVKRKATYFGKLKMKAAYLFHRTLMNVVMMSKKHKK
ncbi:hypothetical protein CNR22_00815 [Sphingobacteriaceae bacterium]|nr:hypothetical protein CNR22_00815 [Sphingobacteriaceae bacterium]